MYAKETRIRSRMGCHPLAILVLNTSWVNMARSWVNVVLQHVGQTLAQVAWPSASRMIARTTGQALEAHSTLPATAL